MHTIIQAIAAGQRLSPTDSASLLAWIAKADEDDHARVQLATQRAAMLRVLRDMISACVAEAERAGFSHDEIAAALDAAARRQA